MSEGQSPLVFATGEKTKLITIVPVAPAKYYPEKLVTLTLDPQHTTCAVDSELNLNHVWIRSTTAPPAVEFASPASSAVPGDVHSIRVDEAYGASDHLEDIELWFHQVGGTAVEGVDYVWLPDAAATNGYFTIPDSSTTTNVQLHVLPGARSGTTLILGLRHERNDRSEENHWSQSGNWHLEAPRDMTDPLGSFVRDTTPGTPGSAVTGPLMGNPPLQLTVTDDPLVRTPWGEVAQRLQYSPDAGTIPPSQGGALYPGPAYVRKSAEGQVHAAAPFGLVLITPAYVRFSCYYMQPTGMPVGRFMRIGCRDRGFTYAAPQTTNTPGGVDYGVVFDRESESSSAIAHSTGSWAVWSIQNGDQATDTVTGGVQVEKLRDSNGVVGEYVRLWCVVHIADPVRLNVNCFNTIHYSVWWWNDGPGSGYIPVTATGNSVSIVGGVIAHRGSAGIFFWPMLEYGDEELSGPPGLYHPKPQSSWEPQGGATIDPQGTTVHTVTIQ